MVVICIMTWLSFCCCCRCCCCFSFVKSNCSGCVRFMCVRLVDNALSLRMMKHEWNVNTLLHFILCWIFFLFSQFETLRKTNINSTTTTTDRCPFEKCTVIILFLVKNKFTVNKKNLYFYFLLQTLAYTALAHRIVQRRSAQSAVCKVWTFAIDIKVWSFRKSKLFISCHALMVHQTLQMQHTKAAILLIAWCSIVQSIYGRNKSCKLIFFSAQLIEIWWKHFNFF